MLKAVHSVLACIEPRSAKLAVTHEAYRLFFGQVVETIESYLNGRLPSRALNAEAMARRVAGLNPNVRNR